MNALIGWSGFVGSTIARQAPAFDRSFRSTDIEDIGGSAYDLVVCAGAPGAKWVANREPQADGESVARLMTHLRAVRCQRFVLISTVDVFSAPWEVDEASVVSGGQSAYGQHRYDLERFVSDTFPGALVLRLPGLVGPGLRKNALFDLSHRNNIKRLDAAAQYQFYPTHRIWADIQLALRADLRLVHLVAPPLRLGDIARRAFGVELTAQSGGSPPCYNVRSRHAAHFGGVDAWPVSRDESLTAIAAYAQTESQARS